MDISSGLARRANRLRLLPPRRERTAVWFKTRLFQHNFWFSAGLFLGLDGVVPPKIRVCQNKLSFNRHPNRGGAIPKGLGWASRAWSKGAGLGALQDLLGVRTFVGSAVEVRGPRSHRCFGAVASRHRKCVLEGDPQRPPASEGGFGGGESGFCGSWVCEGVKLCGARGGHNPTTTTREITGRHSRFAEGVCAVCRRAASFITTHIAVVIATVLQ